MVGDAGFEPATSAVWRQRSPTELIAPGIDYTIWYKQFLSNSGKLLDIII